jgi:hypothetical protein
MPRKQHQLFLGQLDSTIKFRLCQNAPLTGDCVKPEKHHKGSEQNKTAGIRRVAF